MYEQEKIKPYKDEGHKREQVERMFDRIAHSYDRLNHFLSWGIDKSWRRTAVDSLSPFHPRRILDVATGTGDFAILSARKPAMWHRVDRMSAAAIESSVTPISR